jgi:hypothetical protein
MAAEGAADAAHEELVRDFERALVQRTGGRVSRLEIGVAPGRVMVRCAVPSYHVKQLALLGILQVLRGAKVVTDVILDIQVTPGSPYPDAGCDGAWGGPWRIGPPRPAGPAA